jgi:hypothetical protein
VIPVQLLLITVAMVGFNQEWHVEEERPVGGVPLPGEEGDSDEGGYAEPDESRYDEADEPHDGEQDRRT